MGVTEAVSWDDIAEHECLFTLFSHTSYRDGEERDVLYCTFPRCPNWVYGTTRAENSQPRPE